MNGQFYSQGCWRIYADSLSITVSKLTMFTCVFFCFTTLPSPHHHLRTKQLDFKNVR